MSARVILGNIEHRPNARGEAYAYTRFEIMSHDGSIEGEIGVPLANDATVAAETKMRLRDLLRDALADLDRGPLKSGGGFQTFVGHPRSGRKG
jgi:hypothetical protein